MTTYKIRYLTPRPGRGGTMRWFWQPSRALRAAGWPLTRVAEHVVSRGPVPPPEAVAEAQAWNAKLDAWRGGAALPDAPPPTDKGTVDQLIADYKASRLYLDLAARTRRGYDQNLAVLSAWAGPEAARDITKKQCNGLYERLRRRTPAKARAVMVMARILFTASKMLYHPAEPGFVDDNPAAALNLKSTAAKGRLWSREAVDYVAAAADELGLHSIGTAVILNEWIGQREGDLIALAKSVYRGGRLIFEQSKRGAGVSLNIAMVPRLKTRLDDEMARQAARKVTATTLIVNEATGRPYDEHSFRKAYAKARARAAEMAENAGEDALAAEIRALWFMHLRHTAVTRLAEAAVDNKLIAAVTGHSEAGCSAIIDRYMIRTAAMADDAFAQRLEKEAGE